MDLIQSEAEQLSPRAEKACRESLTDTGASIHITRDAREVKLEVRDQGKGMPPGTHRNSPRCKTGVGIQGMRERIGQLGGYFEIRSGKNGTVVVAILPVTNISALSATLGLAS